MLAFAGIHMHADNWRGSLGFQSIGFRAQGSGSRLARNYYYYYRYCYNYDDEEKEEDGVYRYY